MKALILAPALVSTLLSAQDTAPTLAERFKTESPVITQLLATFEAKQALAKAEALLPATKPTFDSSSPQAGLKSSQEFGTLMSIYVLAGKGAISAGELEKGLDLFRKAKLIANENQAGTAQAFAPATEMWKQAEATGKKALEEGAALHKELTEKTSRTPLEEKELANFKTHENNVRTAPIATKQMQDMVEGLKEDASRFDAPIESIEKSVKAEMEQLTSPQFKGDKAKYVAAVMNPGNLETRTTKADKISFVNRLLFLDPTNKKAQHQMDILMGRATAEPEKKAPHKGKKKKGN